MYSIFSSSSSGKLCREESNARGYERSGKSCAPRSPLLKILLFSLFLLFSSSSSSSALFQFNESFCNIPRFNSRDLNTLLLGKDINDWKAPFIIEDERDRSRNSELSVAASRESVLNRFGKVEVRLSSSNAFSHGNKVSTIEDYIHEIVDMPPPPPPSLTPDTEGNVGLEHEQEQQQLANETFYLFGSNLRNEFESLVHRLYQPPTCGPVCSFALEDRSGTISSGIGGAGAALLLQ